MAQPTPEDTARLLTRLSQKPGVSSTLILSRATGAVVRASGLLTSSADPTDLESAPENTSNLPNPAQSNRNGTLNGANGTVKDKKQGTRDAEEVAKLVWSFFKHAGETVEGMFGEGEDEARLVRLRTRKSEVVVVPDAKFLLCVIHDTPPA